MPSLAVCGLFSVVAQMVRAGRYADACTRGKVSAPMSGLLLGSKRAVAGLLETSVAPPLYR